MTPEEFTIECRRTERRDDWKEITPELSNNVRLLYTLIGLTTEANEALDVFKKCLFYKRPFALDHFASELSDCMWYLTMAADIAGFSLEDIMQINVDKLRKRYPEKFTTELANNRQKGDI
jgi:NTP pyrophosphatase (non-canonical NTP hydrolase)